MAAAIQTADPVEVSGGRKEISYRLEGGEKLSLAAFVLESGELDIKVDLAGEGAEFHLWALHVAAGENRTSINVTVNHLAPECTSRQTIKGIAGGSATGSFVGLIRVAQDAQRTDAAQRSQNLQLSDKAHIYTRPQLEIYADDVRCSHGATVGRLDEEAIYYMRQRGVSEAEARRMQLQGFAGEIVNHCESVDYRTMIGEKISQLLDRI